MDAIANLEEQYSDLSKHIEESRESLGSLNKELRELRKERMEAENAVALCDNKLNSKQQEKNATEKEIVNSERVLGEINSELRDAKRDAAIAELFEKQQPFWDALQKRIEFQISELDSGFEGIDEPKDAAKVVAWMQSRVEDRDFSIVANEIRGAKNHYESAVKRVCQMSVDGHRATPEHKRERLNILDRFLSNERIIGLWC
jgi:chromosome segregation ATPase